MTENTCKDSWTETLTNGAVWVVIAEGTHTADITRVLLNNSQDFMNPSVINTW